LQLLEQPFLLCNLQSLLLLFQEFLLLWLRDAWRFVPWFLLLV
jgi:hypothetical protein